MGKIKYKKAKAVQTKSIKKLTDRLCKCAFKTVEFNDVLRWVEGTDLHVIAHHSI